MSLDSLVKSTALTLLLLVFLGCTHSAQTSPSSLATVLKVHDGDTLTALYRGKTERLRLYGIDCPESDQPYGKEATEVTRALVLNAEVTILDKGKDRYGRILAEVGLLDGRSLNRELVKTGACWWYRKYSPDDMNLERLENEARIQRRGVWATENPIPPWEWRTQH